MTIDRAVEKKTQKEQHTFIENGLYGG